MIRIADMLFEADVDLINETIEVTIPKDYSLTDAQIESLKDAKTLERLEMEYGKEIGVMVTYNLIEWRKVEKVRQGMRFAWQTYRSTDIEQIRQDNEDLTQALLELAEIIGGGANG